MARPPKSLLKDSHPELAKQVVDKTLLDNLSTGSELKIEWQCEKGHKWYAKVYNRTNSKNLTGCPYCNHKKLLVGFNDLATVYPDVAKLCYDPEDAYKLMPLSSIVKKWKCEKGHVWSAPVSRLTLQGSRCPYCSGRLAVIGKTDIGTLYPDIADELADQNLRFTLKVGSSKKVKWVCSKNPKHMWIDTPYSRIKFNRNCPICDPNNRIIQGVNDFATVCPDKVKYMVNKSLATKIGKFSDVNVEWQCDKGHRWKTLPMNLENHWCPVCCNKKVIVGFNDLATTNPDIVKELVDKSIATKVTRGSGKKVEWQCDKGHKWYAKIYSRTGNNSTGCPVCSLAGMSNKERELVDIVKSLVGDTKVLTNVTDILPNKLELDIVVPDKKIAIEFNGVRWHSDFSDKSKNYHLDKTHMCQNAGFQLIHIWEDDWDDKKDVIIKMLAYKLGCMNKLAEVISDIDARNLDHVYARNLKFCTVEPNEAKVFLNNNHIQGFVTASYYFGLKDNDDILRAVLLVRSSKLNARMKRKDGEWEIQRYATFGVVSGGFTKLLKNAEKYILNLGLKLTKWISFAACDVSNGNLYENSGFVIDSILRPDYKYVGDFTHWKRVPRERFQKKIFIENPKLLWEDGWTESIAAKQNKLYKIYDAGKIRYVKDVKYD